MWQEFGQVDFATGLLRFRGRDHFINLLFGGNTAQKSQNSSHFPNIYKLVAMMIKDTERIRNALLQVVVY